ncbi:hypothetical protein [Clostridium cochlearium]|uniref:Uncharacterized protein n=1 Tax=Clostridium cochlearium TaxID=1494 RepID=A0A2X2WF50_CLOCO|nr:hypothetical protein [Clostridium cochlearium]SQB36193.1 Uncharacterised protein [Clostridium cochlearium]
MDENKIEELLFQIGEEEIKAPPEDIVEKTKNHLEYRHLRYLIPLGFILNMVIVAVIIFSVLPKMSLKQIILWCNICFSLGNGIIALTILCLNNLQEKFE